MTIFFHWDSLTSCLTFLQRCHENSPNELWLPPECLGRDERGWRGADPESHAVAGTRLLREKSLI